MHHSAGWSFGGVVAFEIARILDRRGVDVKGVVLIDSPCPTDPPLLSDTVIQHVLRDDQERVIDASMRKLLVRQFKQSAVLLQSYAPIRGAELDVPLTLLRATAGFSLEGENVPAWFCRERNDTESSVVSLWQEFVGRHVPVWDIPGHHFELFSNVHVRFSFDMRSHCADACIRR